MRPFTPDRMEKQTFPGEAAASPGNAKHTRKAVAFATALLVCLRCVFLRRVVSYRFGALLSSLGTTLLYHLPEKSCYGTVNKHRSFYEKQNSTRFSSFAKNFPVF
jgi:hypothetical protein